MSLPIHFSDGGDIQFHPGLPLNFKGPFVANAVTNHAATGNSYVAIQQYIDPLFSFRYNVAKFFENIQFRTRIEQQGLFIRCQLKDSQRLILSSNNIHVRENQFAGIYTAGGDIGYRFQKHKECHSLDIYYSPDLLQEFTPSYPELEAVLQKGEPSFIPCKSCWIPDEMDRIIYSMLNTSLDKNVISLYYDLKIREMLTHVLHYKFNRKPEKFIPTSYELHRIYAAKDILVEHISKKPPELRRLALQVGLSLGKLREGFQQEFNMSMLEWLTEERLKQSHHLILTTRIPVTMICQEVGYPRVSNFIKAFVRRFGRTPGSYRR